MSTSKYRRWLQFRLRTLVILMTACCGFFGYREWQMKQYAYQATIAGLMSDRAAFGFALAHPQWLSRLLSSERCQEVVQVRLFAPRRYRRGPNGKRIEMDVGTKLDFLQQFPGTQRLYLDHTKIEDRDLADLLSLPRLQRLAVWSNSSCEQSRPM